MKTYFSKKVYTFLISAPLVLVLTGCGQNLSGEAKKAQGLNNGSSNGVIGGNPDLWKGIDTSGQGSANLLLLGTYTQSFDIDPVTGMLSVKIDLPGNIFGGSISYPIQEIPGASVAIQLDPVSGKWQLAFNIPLSALVKGVGPVGPKTLPNGDTLPGVPGGEPPKLGVHVTRGKVDMYIYGSVKYFALFVPTPTLNKYLLLDLNFPIKNKAKTKIVGYFATVSPKRGFDSGLYLSVVFPPELSALLDTIF